MSVLEPSLPAVQQSGHVQLFRLPYELRHRIYQYVLTPAHVHIERKVDYELTHQGIKLIVPKPREASATVALDQIISVHQGDRESREELVDEGSEIEADEDGNSTSEGEDESEDESDDGSEESEQFSRVWNCSKLFLDSDSPDFLKISSKNGELTLGQARSKLFRIYYCRSQKSSGPSAVPPGYLDHEACVHDAEQAEFEGSTISGFRATCQWAYTETLASAAYQNSQVVVFAPFLDRDSPRLELASHNLHFSDLKDLACFTGLVPEAMSESFHSLSVHIPSIHNDYWSYFCNIYLQPWSRLSLSNWLRSPADKAAQVTFYHNHTTHDLADPSATDPTERREIEEALASTWVVPNIQIHSQNSSWSTKFRMAALRRRAGGPLDLRISFPMFLRREEPRFQPCLVGRKFWAEPYRDEICQAALIPHAKEDHTKPDWFDARRWLSDRLGDMPIPVQERNQTYRPTWHGEEWRENTPAGADLPEDRAKPHPGDPDTMCEMERALCSQTWEMEELIKERLWLEVHENWKHKDELTAHQAAYDQSFRKLFLRQRRDGNRQDLLRYVNLQLGPLNECQGLESLEIDFFGDAHSPGIVQEIQSVGTNLLREGLVERFTGKEWRTRGVVDADPVSACWAIGPHPEPFFHGWADPNGNMVGMNMDDNWRH